jgi:uncharacterized damage-inducible protein DinB
MSDVGRLLIDDARRRIKGLAEQVRTCVEALPDGDLWARAHEKANSVGNLVLHVCGSTRHFLGRAVGGTDYVRDRPGEFAERGPIPREDLLRTLADTVAEAERVLDGVAPDRLMDTTDRAGKVWTLAELILRTAHHWSLHTGQIVFETKARQPGAFEELWMKTMETR